MTVWAVIERHRVVSVWTTEQDAWKACDPEKGQIIVESQTTSDVRAWVSPRPVGHVDYCRDMTCGGCYEIEDDQ